ncbi:hypothetical protein BB559_000128 [Furculomyces boomerangus]|uniref:Uncharacterized protein n=2 Tax=Harpellales TaxID=61421 RepID=A0A2T9Z6B0_9FUNG|nr:hypothetical protein BB559_000128 [Furculomyces boomerangus]PWA03370.1 hypothetical protein BB558_000471 [Smittium angustum]
MLSLIYGFVHESGIVKAIWTINDQLSAFNNQQTLYQFNHEDKNTLICLSSKYQDNVLIDTNQPEFITNVWFVYTLSPPMHLLNDITDKDKFKVNLKSSTGMSRIELFNTFLNSTKLSYKNPEWKKLIQGNQKEKNDVSACMQYKQISPGLYERTLVVIPSIYKPSYFAPTVYESTSKSDFNKEKSTETSLNFDFEELYSFPFHIEFDSIGEYFTSGFSSTSLKCYQLVEVY